MTAASAPLWCYRQIRRLTCLVLYHSGLLWLLVAWKLRRSAVVLMYHRVLPRDGRDTFSSTGTVVTPESFERQMRLLRRRFNPISVPQLARILDGHQPMPSRACVVTFDDGWFDNHAFALPILKRHRIQATVFVATDYVGTGSCFWQERTARQLYCAWRSGKCKERLACLGLALSGIADEAEALSAISSLIAARKGAAAHELHRWIEATVGGLDCAGTTRTDVGHDRFMDWDQVRELSASGLLTIGSHACTHRPLTTLAPEELRHELTEARRLLLEKLGEEVRFLAYPNGDHDSAVTSASRDAGYLLGFTTEPGFVAEGDDKLRLRRMNIHESATDSDAAFLCRLVGLC